MNRIPKKLHMYWDNSPMSRLQVFTVETFHRFNPDWEIFVHIPLQTYNRNVHYVDEYVGKDHFYLIKQMDYVKIQQIDINKYGIDGDLHNILRSDIFRYHILHDIGGMWSDFDIVWLKPMSEMNNVPHIGKVKINYMGAIACLSNMTTGHYNIGVLFGTPGHSLYKALINKANVMQTEFKNKDLQDHQDYGVYLWLSLYKDLYEMLDDHPDVVGIPYETFAPYFIHNIETLYKRNDVNLISNYVLGVHWFNGHPYGKEYVNNDFYNKGVDCSLTTILKYLNYMED